jgi:acyl dehydratase
MTATTTVKAGWRGRFFEDFVVGDVYQHPLGRTISEVDCSWFALLTMNTAEPHFNVEVGRASEFGRLLVPSTLTLAVVGGLSVVDTSQNAFANLGWERVLLPKPVFVGDTLWSESLVVGKRESGSRPQAGIVTVKTRGLNQHGDEVLSYVRSFFVYKNGSRPRTFPQAKTPIATTDTEQSAI